MTMFLFKNAEKGWNDHWNENVQKDVEHTHSISQYVEKPEKTRENTHT